MSVGSPPHTRGILNICPDHNPLYRFTPAYAGNMKGAVERTQAIWVHPRIRGEYSRNLDNNSPSSGSPPHTRGISSTFVLEPFWNRFTPAYAGNIRLGMPVLLLIQVHPRIRGEYRLWDMLIIIQVGSPPHTRGIWNYLNIIHPTIRFTPAYAGNMEVMILDAQRR